MKDSFSLINEKEIIRINLLIWKKSCSASFTCINLNFFFIPANAILIICKLWSLSFRHNLIYTNVIKNNYIFVIKIFLFYSL